MNKDAKLYVARNMTVWKFALGRCWGDLARNHLVIGKAVEHLGLRPSESVVQQAVFQFWSLALPRGVEICSAQAANTRNSTQKFCDTNPPATMHLRCEAQNASQSDQEIDLYVLPFGQVLWLAWMNTSHVSSQVGAAIECLRRPHYPRKKEIRSIYKMAGLNIPGGNTDFFCALWQHIYIWDSQLPRIRFFRRGWFRDVLFFFWWGGVECAVAFSISLLAVARRMNSAVLPLLPRLLMHLWLCSNDVVAKRIFSLLQYSFLEHD